MGPEASVYVGINDVIILSNEWSLKSGSLNPGAMLESSTDKMEGCSIVTVSWVVLSKGVGSTLTSTESDPSGIVSENVPNRPQVRESNPVKKYYLNGLVPKHIRKSKVKGNKVLTYRQRWDLDVLDFPLPS